MLRFGRADRTVLGRWFWTVDRIGFVIVFLLSLIGLLSVATGSSAVSVRVGLDHLGLLSRHLVIVAVALPLMVAISMMRRPVVLGIAFVGLGIGLILLVATLIVGVHIKGATRWIAVPGFTLQPSEFVKPLFAVVNGWLLVRAVEMGERSSALASLALLFLVVGLLILQPDLGMSVVIVGIWACQIFVAGAPLALLLGVTAAGTMGLAAAYGFLPHVRTRVDLFLSQDPSPYSQLGMALRAFEAGGLWGVKAEVIFPGTAEVKFPRWFEGSCDGGVFR
jgi:cell division protein FtsW